VLDLILINDSCRINFYDEQDEIVKIVKIDDIKGKIHIPRALTNDSILLIKRKLSQSNKAKIL
jgi:hypothetical protein